MNTPNETMLTLAETLAILADANRVQRGDFPREFARSLWSHRAEIDPELFGIGLVGIVTSRVRRCVKSGRVWIYVRLRNGETVKRDYMIHKHADIGELASESYTRLIETVGTEMTTRYGRTFVRGFSYNYLNQIIRNADRYLYNQATGHHNDRIMRFDGNEWTDTAFSKLPREDKTILCDSQTKNLPNHLTYLRVFPALSIEDTSPEPTIAESIRMPEDTTQLEQLVIKLISEGYSLRQIAPRIGRNKNQVETLVRKIRNDAKIRDNYAYNDTNYNARYSTVKNPPIRTNRRGAPINPVRTTVVSLPRWDSYTPASKPQAKVNTTWDIVPGGADSE